MTAGSRPFSPAKSVQCAVISLTIDLFWYQRRRQSSRWATISCWSESRVPCHRDQRELLNNLLSALSRFIHDANNVFSMDGRKSLLSWRGSWILNPEKGPDPAIDDCVHVTQTAHISLVRWKWQPNTRSVRYLLPNWSVSSRPVRSWELLSQRKGLEMSL